MTALTGTSMTISMFNPATHKAVPIEAVVLDPAPEWPARIVEALRAAADGREFPHIFSSWRLSNLADAIEAQIHPPKPDEPEGLGAVIVADEPGDPTGEYKQARLTRTGVTSVRSWIDDDGDWYCYAELTNVTILHDGFPT